MMKSKKFAGWLASIALVLLSACGGGGGNSGIAAPTVGPAAAPVGPLAATDKRAAAVSSPAHGGNG